MAVSPVLSLLAVALVLICKSSSFIDENLENTEMCSQMEHMHHLCVYVCACEGVCESVCEHVSVSECVCMCV